MSQTNPLGEPIRAGFTGTATAAEWREVAEILAAVVTDQERHLRRMIDTAVAVSERSKRIGNNENEISFRTYQAGALSARRDQLGRMKAVDLTLARNVVAWTKE